MNKIKVLLVEDETSLAMILSDTLEAQGFEMRTAHDGEEGLRMFDELKPDVLVADVMMPKMDGFEMMRRIRKTDSRTPVLFLTARSAVNDVVEGFELGGNDYLRSRLPSRSSSSVSSRFVIGFLQEIFLLKNRKRGMFLLIIRMLLINGSPSVVIA